MGRGEQAEATPTRAGRPSRWVGMPVRWGDLAAEPVAGVRERGGGIEVCPNGHLRYVGTKDGREVVEYSNPECDEA